MSITSGHREKVGKNIKHFFVNLYFYLYKMFNVIYLFNCVQTLWTPFYVSRLYAHPLCPDFMDTLLCVQTLWTPSVSRLYGHTSMCPDFMDTICVQTLWTHFHVSRLWTPSVSRLYGHPVEQRHSPGAREGDKRISRHPQSGRHWRPPCSRPGSATDCQNVATTVCPVKEQKVGLTPDITTDTGQRKEKQRWKLCCSSSRKVTTLSLSLPTV